MGEAETPEPIDYDPNPSDAEIRELCEAWVRYQAKVREAEPDDDDPDWWAVDAVLDFVGPPPRLDLQWRVIRCLCSLVDVADDEVVGMIGASPLEGFLRRWGDRAMDLIEPAADNDPVLLAALRGVWASRDPVGPRVDRYLAARGAEPPPN